MNPPPAPSRPPQVTAAVVILAALVVIGAVAMLATVGSTGALVVALLWAAAGITDAVLLLRRRNWARILTVLAGVNLAGIAVLWLLTGFADGGPGARHWLVLAAGGLAAIVVGLLTRPASLEWFGAGPRPTAPGAG